MAIDEMGFNYPETDDTVCIKCNKCIDSCPANDQTIRRREQKFPQKVYAAWVKNRKTRFYSTSGGLFIALAKFVLQKQGVVFGVEWHGYGARHNYCTRIEDLKKFQGSKYVQSDINDSYLIAEKFLLENRTVLFSGTPCQIAGLNSYLGKPYENLLTIDLVCHGVPSPKILKEYLEQTENEQDDRITNVRFRHKTPSWFLTSVKFDFAKKASLLQSVHQNPYFRGFVENFYLREACYQCKYANTERDGDITLADFWHYYPSELKYVSYKKGTSLVIINSEKGMNFFRSIRSGTVYEEKEMKLAIKGNSNLSKPQLKPLHYSLFWEDYFSGTGFNDLSYKYFPPVPVPHISLKSEIRFRIKFLIPAFVRNTLILYRSKWLNQQNKHDHQMLSL